MRGHALQHNLVVSFGCGVQGNSRACRERAYRYDNREHGFEVFSPANTHVDSQIVAAGRFDPPNFRSVIFGAGAFQHRRHVRLFRRAHGRIPSPWNNLILGNAGSQRQVSRNSKMSLCAARLSQNATGNERTANRRDAVWRQPSARPRHRLPRCSTEGRTLPVRQRIIKDHRSRALNVLVARRSCTPSLHEQNWPGGQRFTSVHPAPFVAAGAFATNKPHQKFRSESGAPTPKDCRAVSCEVSLVHVAKHETGDFRRAGKVFQESESA
jgi:hypothetical protein